jgi:hypothetical protein
VLRQLSIYLGYDLEYRGFQPGADDDEGISSVTQNYQARMAAYIFSQGRIG